jgi:hypothetical protein
MANAMSYIGSPEHKDTPSFAGHPRPRADASICSRTFARDQLIVNQWLQAAILAANYSEFFEGDFSSLCLVLGCAKPHHLRSQAREP